MGNGCRIMTTGLISLISEQTHLHHQNRSVHHYYLCSCLRECSFILHYTGMTLQNITKRLDAILYAGLYCWLAIGATMIVTKPPFNDFQQYMQALVALFISMLPVLIVAWNRYEWRITWDIKKYRLCWWLCFGTYVPLVMLIASLGILPGLAQVRDTLITGGVFTLLLELILVLNTCYRQRAKKWQWFRSISLDKAIFISLLIIAVLLSLMAVSSTGDTRYERGDQLLIGFEIDAGKLIRHPLLFCWFFVQFLFMYACGYLYFLLNSQLLVPVILRKYGAVMYCLTGLAIVSITYPLIGAILNWLPVNQRLGNIFPDNPFNLDSAFGAILILLISLPILLALQWSKQNNQIMALEKEKSETELALLKQQLNPHFFFNTLNNLYALSLTQSKQTPESILQLSELMRYVIYRAKEDKVAVQEEVKYIEDYIQLQQIRLKRSPDIQFTQDISPDTPPVAPLLLIVLVENAFKHGIEPAEGNSTLHLHLSTTASSLRFSCTNSFEQFSETGAGIGLQNLERRLQLLYPGKHLLKTEKENHIFKAELELELL